MRVERRQRAEEEATKVPVEVSVPLLVCILPALAIVVLRPGVPQPGRRAGPSPAA